MNRHTPVWKLAAGAGLIALAAAAATAQPSQPSRPSGGVPDRFVKVDPTIGDVDPLRQNGRNLPIDLRQPLGFRDVFRIEGSRGDASRWGVANATGGDLLARMSGAVTAVFPQSVYVDTRRGPVALIPPGTVFFIGGLPPDPLAETASEPPPSPHRVDHRVSYRVDDAPGVPAASQRRTPSRQLQAADPGATNQPIEPATQTPVASIMTDETMRRNAVRELLTRAADPKPTAPSDKEKGPTPGAAEPAKHAETVKAPTPEKKKAD